MKYIKNPISTIIVTLLSSLVFLFAWSEMPSTNLSEIILGLTLIGLIVNLGYSIYRLANEEDIVLPSILFNIGLYFLLLIFYTFSVLRLNTDSEIYNFLLGVTSIAAILIYQFLILFSSKANHYLENPALNFVISVLITPLLFYLLFMGISYLFSSSSENYFFTTLIIVSASVIMVFFLIRGLYFLVINYQSLLQRYSIFIKIIVCIVFPWGGLFLNEIMHVFGDFSSIWFYILVGINGILLCIPPQNNQNIRLWIFFGLSIGYTVLLYFFLVFFPFIIVAIPLIVVGVGLLCLTPLFVFLIQSRKLLSEYKYLSAYFPQYLLVLSFVVGIILLPTILFTNFTVRKKNVNQAMDYVLFSDYTKSYSIDTKMLMDDLSKKKAFRKDFLFENQTPILSSLYFKYVWKDASLSEENLILLKRIFSNQEEYNKRSSMALQNLATDSVLISNISSLSEFDKENNTWRTWLNLEISNLTERSLLEYHTNLQLPEGCYINNYYLDVNEVREYGLLVDKRAAIWVYNQIVSRAKDPGILVYTGNNTINFRVFPFGPKEVRKTGISFLHKEPFQLTIDDKKVFLGDSTKMDTLLADSHYISAKQKESLEVVTREPYLHFIVDISQDKDGSFNRQINNIKKILTIQLTDPSLVKIDLVNSKIYSFSDVEAIKEPSVQFQHGFFLDYAIRNCLVNAYKGNNNTYPIIVVMSDNIEQAIVNKNFSNLDFTFPESPYFYSYQDNSFFQHSLLKDPLSGKPVQSIQTNNSVRTLKKDKSTIYLADNREASLLFSEKELSLEHIQENSWEAGYLMQNQVRRFNLNPSLAKQGDLALIKASFNSRVMNPYTSYIVVETEEQRKMLLEKQKNILEGKENEEGYQRMSEPPLYILILVALAFVFYRKSRFNRKSSRN